MKFVIAAIIVVMLSGCSAILPMGDFVVNLDATGATIITNTNVTPAETPDKTMDANTIDANGAIR